MFILWQMETYQIPRRKVTEYFGIGDVFTGLLDQWGVKHRFGAIRQHRSISIMERVIKTLKYEWLKRVPIIKGFDHLTML